MEIELWTPRSLFALRRDDRMDDTPSYFLDTYFGGDHFAQDGEVKFGDLEEANRFLAPFVLPYEQGKPMVSFENERIEAFKLPYIKVKNAVRPEDVKNIRPSEIFRNNGQRPSPAQLFDARTAELDRRHRRAIRMREAWMAARAFVDAKIRIDYERDLGQNHPSVELNFGRSADQNVVKTGGFWDDPDADILGDVEGYMNTMYLASGGGTANVLLVGARVAPVFRRNKGVKEMLDTRYRGNEDVVINTGIMRTERPLSRIGQLATGLEIWTYKDTVDIPLDNGSKQRVDLFNEKDILLIAPGANGTKARGPIYDTKAMASGLWAEEVFAKQWETEDPGERFMMHQASFLPIPLYPNRTFKSRVLR